LNISNEVKVGLLAIVAAVLLYLGFNFLRGTSVFNKQRTFYVVYDDVAGLVTSSPVHFKGMTVGMVSGIDILDNANRDLLVTLTVDNEDVKLPANTAAQIYSPGIIEDRAIQLLINPTARDKNVRPNFSNLIEDGDTLVSDKADDIQDVVYAEVLPVKEKAEVMLGSIDSVLQIIQGIFNERAKRNIQTSLGTIESTLGNFEVTTNKLNTLIDEEQLQFKRIMDNVESITSNLDATNKQVNTILAQNEMKINQLVQNAEDFTMSLKSLELVETIKNANKILADVESKVESINTESGSLGLLLNDDGLYNQLQDMTSTLEGLVEDVQENPKDYFNIKAYLIERKNKD